MVHASQIVLGLLAASSPHFQSTNQPHLTSSKTVAVVGAGTSGLAVLDTLLRYKEAHSVNWTITVFEQRGDVGGVWLPNDHQSEPPEIPMTPLYPRLRTNSAVPFMTCPRSPFPEGTPLYSPPHHIEEYHQQYARKNGLYPYIKFNHSVTSTQWIGNSTIGHWGISYTTNASAQYGYFDHLVVAAGNHHLPRIPSWQGQNEWLAHKNHRRMIHSIWFHTPEEYEGVKVLIVGSGPSGKDIATQLASFCEVHMSKRNNLDHHMDPRVIIRPDIVHFTKDAVVFSDSTIYEADIVILCTGYERRYPFLEANGTLSVEPGSSRPVSRLTSNLRYIYPLHHHIFSLDPSYPVTALSFIGLPSLVYYCPIATAQSVYLAHALANPNILQNRKTLLQQLANTHQDMENRGDDPYYIGHRLGSAEYDYEDGLIEYLMQQGALPQDGRRFVEAWRRELPDVRESLPRGWLRVEKQGLESEWLAGVSNESEWASMMRRLNMWELEQERLERIL